jgi:hypothetical protein
VLEEFGVLWKTSQGLSKLVGNAREAGRVGEQVAQREGRAVARRVLEMRSARQST